MTTPSGTGRDTEGDSDGEDTVALSVLPEDMDAFVNELTPAQRQEYSTHLDYFRAYLEEYGDPGVDGLVSVNEAAVRAAGELLAQEYVDADEYGEREAEIAAVLSLLNVDLSVGSVWDPDGPSPDLLWGDDDEA